MIMIEYDDEYDRMRYTLRQVSKAGCSVDVKFVARDLM